MKLAAAILVVMSGVLFAQTNTNDPTDTPTVRALTALIPMRQQANYGLWLSGQARQSLFAQWLEAQTTEARKARFVSALGQPQVLLGTRAAADKPNYGGNAFAPLQRTLWLRMARGESVAE
jgi:hypothetical protein